MRRLNPTLSPLYAQKPPTPKMLVRFSSAANCALTSSDHNQDHLIFVPNPLVFHLGGRRNPLGLSFPRKKKFSMLRSPSRVRSSIKEDGISSSDGEQDLPIHGVSNTVVGVLGGGQLGRMLCQAASKMAIKVATLDPLENCPASALSYEHVVGSFNDGDAIREFAKRCGVLTVEIEHVDAVTLELLEQQGIDCQPKASTIKIIQDKYLQKVHFSQHGIPLPDFVQIDDLTTLEKAGDLFGYPLMIKSKRLAYDGRGNAVAYNKEELPSVVTSLGGFAHGLYVERWTPFLKELSVIVARSRDGSLSCYSVVETIHKDNICHIVESPANVSEEVKILANDVAQKAIGSLEGAGVFAVELFLTKDGQVLLNEVAPRPHNSGHHTIESCYTSQYEQHLRAVLGLPLGDPSMKVPAAIMYNILGEDKGETGFYLAHQLIKRALNISGATVHWYDKPEIRKQRKMGHITIVGPSRNAVKARLNKLLQRDTIESSKLVTPCVAIIMGSDSDLPTMKDAAEVLETFGVPFELTIVSAHRTPERMYSFALSAKERGIQVIIAGAGGAAHLPGMVASLTPLPVIGVPIKTSSMSGVDSLLSIVQMPKGIPVATVAIGNAANAALLAVRMLASADADLWARWDKSFPKISDMERLRCSIEMEPRTLNVEQLNNAREAAMDVVQEKEPIEASIIFTEGKKAVLTMREMEKKIERQNQFHKLVEIKEALEVPNTSGDYPCSPNNSEESPDDNTRKEPLSSPF
ncbi:phosphoribosylaminoimidazole carboxylase, chloroplastic-like isoform X2 [Ananas comosus]|uniref:phosphoribosylaminoimidazole carboxylase n=1 Tax=Ananas comosus TaxID=4615 RepID=A0A6P5FWT6_ANACO|nr:phosphoribosylaminoimidazole carboxylase, chloroplastic-like isoform X2 [Ananas comosus]